MSEKNAVRSYYENTSQSRTERLERKGLNLYRDLYLTHADVFRSLLREHGPFEAGLDIGTGPGVWAEFLTNYCSHVIGVDFVEALLRHARDSAEGKGLSEKVTFRFDDAEDLNTIADESFDLVFQISVLQHLAEPDKALRRIHAVLKPAGLVVLLVQNRRCLYNYHLRSSEAGNNRIGINEYSELLELSDRLKRIGFEIEAVRPCWLFLRDLPYIGADHRVLRLLHPVRRLLLAGLDLLERALNRKASWNPLFREIVLLCRKPE